MRNPGYQRRSVLLFLLLLGLAGHMEAQGDCTDEALLSVKGSWKKDPDAGMHYDKHQSEVIRRLDSISKLYQAACPQPKGIEAVWYRSMSDPILPGAPMAYMFNSLYKPWYCNQHVHKMLLSDETGTWSYVWINSFGWFKGDRRGNTGIKVDGADVFVLPHKTGMWKGYELYELSINGGRRERCILLTHGNQLPWKPVTQEQYLQAVRGFLEEQRKTAMGPSPAQQAEDDRKEIERIQNNPYATAEMKKTTIAAVQKRQALQRQSQQPGGGAARIAGEYDQQIRRVDEYLSHTNRAVLAQPAVVPRQNRTLFDGGFSTVESGGLQLAIVNPDYFDRQAPLYIPQFMVLYWSWEKNAPAQHFMQQFEADFPVERLQALLDQPVAARGQ